MQQADRLRFSHLMVAAVLVAVLAGCNSGESFSDGTRIEGPVIDGTGRGSALDSDPTIPRVIGLIANRGPLQNIGFRCGDVTGYTGRSGIQQEQDANYFVCPASSRKVEFFIGGELNSITLGSAWFECSPENTGAEDCQSLMNAGAYEVVGDDSDAQEVLAPRPMLLSLADIIEPPARLDLSLTESSSVQRLYKIGAMLQGLGAGQTVADEVVIDDRVHELLDEGRFSTLNEALDTVDFADFVARGGTLDLLMQAVEDNGGTVGLLPANMTEVRRHIDSVSHATSAGLYVLEMESSIYAFTLHFVGGLVPSVFPVTDALGVTIVNAAENPDTGAVDEFVKSQATSSVEFMPIFMIDRFGRVLGGGAYDVLDTDLAALRNLDEDDSIEDFDGQLRLDYVCSASKDTPDFFTVAEQARLSPSNKLSTFQLRSVNESVDTLLSLQGTLFAGRGFHGVSRAGVDITDYQVIYPYESIKPFDAEEDAVLMNGVACKIPTNDLIVNSFYRVGLVEPFLDPDVMNHFFGQGEGPAAYNIRFWSRVNLVVAGFEELSPEELPVTVHADGSIFTNLVDAEERNAGYDTDPARNTPQGEYLVGMVTSVQRDEDESDNPGKAKMNIYVHAVGEVDGVSATNDLPHFGKRFRAQLLPGDSQSCENSLIEPGSFAASSEDNGNRAFWYDSYGPVEAMRELDGGTALQRHEIIRTRAYGQVTAVSSFCDDE